MKKRLRCDYCNRIIDKITKECPHCGEGFEMFKESNIMKKIKMPRWLKYGLIFGIYGMCAPLIMLIIHSMTINQWGFVPILFFFTPGVYVGAFFTARIAELFSSNLIIKDMIIIILNFLIFFLIGMLGGFLIDKIKKNG